MYTQNVKSPLPEITRAPFSGRVLPGAPTPGPNRKPRILAKALLRKPVLSLTTNHLIVFGELNHELSHHVPKLPPSDNKKTH